MDRNDAREILKRWANINDEIRRAEEAYKAKCDEIDIVAMIPSPVQKMSGMPHSQGLSQSTERTALRRIEIAEAHREELEALNSAVIEAMKFRAKVDGCLILCAFDEEAVVRQHYQQKKTMVRIANLMHISERTAWYYEEKVLDTICETWI